MKHHERVAITGPYESHHLGMVTQAIHGLPGREGDCHGQKSQDLTGGGCGAYERGHCPTRAYTKH